MNKKMESMTSGLEACLVEIAILELHADGIVLNFESLERPQRYLDSIKSFCTENDLFDKP